MNKAASIADVQAAADTRRIAIDKVGIKDIRHPLRVTGRGGAVQHTVATFSMYVNLPHDKRGTHMSRFVEILNANDIELSVSGMRRLLEVIRRTLSADHAYVDVRFPYFIAKKAPVSGVTSALDYEVALHGEHAGDHAEVTLKVMVPVTSLCPCSKEISRYGAHNQRSHVVVAARVAESVYFEDLIELIEQEASCEIFGLVKRTDEKYITERAYENPKFVEDMVRDVAARLDADARILAYTVETENFESIHNHSAYAHIRRDKK